MCYLSIQLGYVLMHHNIVSWIIRPPARMLEGTAFIWEGGQMQSYHLIRLYGSEGTSVVVMVVVVVVVVVVAIMVVVVLIFLPRNQAQTI